jgi:hypothetical protein
VRLGNPNAHLEAITSWPFLLSAVARQTTHGGAMHLSFIISQHAEADKAKALLGAIHAPINSFKVPWNSSKPNRSANSSVSIF